MCSKKKAFTVFFASPFWVSDEIIVPQQSCNARWKDNFEYSLNTTLADFYEFPLHPLLLDHSSFLLYCKLAQQKTTCYMNQCNDQVPSNPNFQIFKTIVKKSCENGEAGTDFLRFPCNDLLIDFKSINHTIPGFFKGLKDLLQYFVLNKIAASSNAFWTEVDTFKKSNLY